MAKSAGEAFLLMRAWAEAGVAEAQTILGQLLLDGRGAPVDPEAAFGWFSKAAAAGHPMGLNMAGRCLENGIGVSPDPVKSTALYAKSARAGLAWGMYNYATSLALGRGVEEDREAAFAWLSKAVEMGHAKSMAILGGFYEDGWVVEKNDAQARALYEASARAGDFRGHFNFARFLVRENNIPEATDHLNAAYGGGTPAFRDKMLTFLRQSGHHALQGAAARLEFSAGGRRA